MANVVYVNSSKTYSASGKGTTFVFKDEDINAVLKNTSSKDRLDFGYYDTYMDFRPGEYTRLKNDLQIKFYYNEYDDDDDDDSDYNNSNFYPPRFRYWEEFACSVRIKNYFSKRNKIEQISFDGRTLQLKVDKKGSGSDDFIFSVKKKGKLVGGAGNDFIYGTNGTNQLYGEKGNDILYGRGGNDKLYGGAGKDKLYGESGKDKLYGDGGGDCLIGGDGNDELYGGAGKDELYGESGNDKLYGGDGNDKLHGGAGNDILSGGAGKDIFIYKCGNDSGKDIITDYKAGEDTLHISSEETISKTKLSGNNVVFTVGKGSITLKNVSDKTISLSDHRGSYTVSNTTIKLGKDFSSTMDAQKFLSSVKTIDGRNAAGYFVWITGNLQDNIIYAGKNGGTYKGGAGNDQLYGGAGDDCLNGDDGNDILYGGTGNDKLTGGAGKDTFVYSEGDGNDIIYDYSEEDILNIKKGSITKTELPNGTQDVSFTVGTGKITLKGAAEKGINIVDSDGSYKVWGNTPLGNAISLGADFKGTLDVNNYFPTVSYIDARNTTQAVNVKGNAQDNDIRASDYGGSYWGGDGDDEILGNSKEKLWLYGEAGNDHLTGGINDDELYGGDGNDNLRGSDGNDKLYGDDGDDKLYGGSGNDELYGGSGNDIFGFTNYSKGNSTIYDYTQSEDIIDISRNPFTKTEIVNNKDVRFTLSCGGSVTLKDAQEKKITIHDYFYGNYTVSKQAITMESNFKGTMDAMIFLPTVQMIDGSLATENLIIKGNSRNNTIYGGSGNDEINGLGGTDTIYGMNGNDTIYSENGSGKIYGGSGNDTITVTKGSSITVDGGAGDDAIISNAGRNHTLNGGTGKDTIEIKLVESNNQIATDCKVDGGSDADKITVFSLTSNIRGGAGDDIIDVSGGSNKVYGDDGNDSIYVNCWMPGSTEVEGGAGNDTICINGGQSVYVDSGAGNDEIYVNVGGNHSIHNSGGNDYIEINKPAGTYVYVYGNQDSATNETVVINGGGRHTVELYDGDDNVTIADGSGHKITFGDPRDNVYVTGGIDNEVYLGGDNRSRANRVNVSGGSITMHTKTNGWNNITVEHNNDVGQVILLAADKDTIQIDGGAYVHFDDMLTISGAKSTDFNYEFKFIKGWINGSEWSSNGYYGLALTSNTYRGFEVDIIGFSEDRVGDITFSDKSMTYQDIYTKVYGNT